MTERRDDMRAGDADRDVVAGRLRGALDEGRLSLTEYDERLQQTYAARTFGDLDAVVADLPSTAPPARSSVAQYEPPPTAPPVSATKPVAPARRGAVSGWLAQVWTAWLVAVLVNVAIWAVVSISSGRMIYFWPIWVAGPWGAVLLATTIGGLMTGEPRRRRDSLDSGRAGARRDSHQFGEVRDEDQTERWRRRAERHQRRADRYRRMTGSD